MDSAQRKPYTSPQEVHSDGSSSTEKIKDVSSKGPHRGLSVECTQPSLDDVRRTMVRRQDSKNSDDPDDVISTAVPLDLSEQLSDEKKAGEDQRLLNDLEDEIQRKKSFRAKLVHTPSRRVAVTYADDRTIRCERYFLRRIERHKHRRLERYCICPVTKWLLFKEKLGRIKGALGQTGRCLWIVCCPPLCCVMSQIAMWPPPNEYFFYIDNIPPRERKEVEGRKEALEIAERKRTIPKILRANKKVFMLNQPLRIGHRHPCADDIEDVEAFVLKTSKKNYIACVRVPTRSTSRYTILYSHPNASDLSDHLVGVPNLMDIARFHKCDVYSYDYSGYGISSGHASESNLRSDIRALYDHILSERGVRADEIVLIGYSIGCFASVDLVCSVSPPPAGLILQSPPTSLLRVLLWDRGCFKQPFNQKSCCGDRLCLYDKIGDVRIPVLVIHGEDDRTVPIVHGKAVCEKAVNRVRFRW
ncbi:hypothetical protein Q1695_005050 [Nippostrongylus brasiliensis]|nr:hypothetical protein Q1695_005050 [Nippostrongylus brasiliensis]